MIPLGYISGIGYGLICLLVAFIIYKLGVPKQYTRKVVHILVGFEWVFLYHFFGAGLHFLIVCVAFLALLIISHFLKLMPMISSDQDNSPGTIYYAAAMTGVAIVGCFLPDVMLPFGVGIFCTSIGDGMAGLIGQALKTKNPEIYFGKTLYGTLAAFVFSYLSAMAMTLIFDMGIGMIEWTIIGVLSAMLELISVKGLDNIAITWGITALTYGFMYYDNIHLYILPIVLTPFVIAFARARHALTNYAIIAAIVVDVLVSLALGNFGFIMLVLFFGLSILVDKIKKRVRGSRVVDEAEKGDCRDHMQVLANGLVPALSASLFFVTKSPLFVILFVTALAEALSDTVASGIGAFSKRTFDIFKWRECNNGISGGVSIVGTLSSLVAAFVLPLVALLFGAFDLKLLLISGISAFLGTVIDTLLGSLLQVKFKCKKCGKITEKHLHCDLPTVHDSGLLAVDNDVVNLLSGFAAVIISAILSLIFIA